MGEPKKSNTNQAKKGKEKSERKSWWRVAASIVLMLVWVFVAVVASQYVVGYLMLWLLGAETFVQPVPTAIYSVLSYTLAMLLIIFVPKLLAKKWGMFAQKKMAEGKKKRKDKSEKAVPTGSTLARAESESERTALGLRDWPTWTDIGLAPAGLIVYLLIATGLTALFSLFPWFDAGETQEVGFSVYIAGFDRVVAFMILVLVAPIVEEIIFRGWLYDKLRGKTLERYSNAVSIVVSNLLVSVLFGIVHMQWNVGVNVFAMSVVMCALREITGTIYAGILLHMLKNGIAFYLLYVLGIT